MIIMPIFSLTTQLGIKGRILLILLYILMHVPSTTTYLLNFFATLSKTYEEAAAIDGCPPGKTFWVIMLPLVQPAIITDDSGRRWTASDCKRDEVHRRLRRIVRGSCYRIPAHFPALHFPV